MSKAKYCRYCRSTKALTLDHKVAKINGGKDKVTNYQVLCKKCNGVKSDIDHKRLMSIARWVHDVNLKRASKEKSALGCKKKNSGWGKVTIIDNTNARISEYEQYKRV